MIASSTYFNYQDELITDAKTWAEANQYSAARGGHLAYIESSEENSAIRDFLLPLSASFPTTSDGGVARYVWLGASDIAAEGVWRWGNYTAVAGYTNWVSGTLAGEPDNYLGVQDAMAMGVTVWPYPSGGLGQVGQWNDINENNRIYFLVEWDSLFGTDGNDRFNGGSGAAIDGLGGIDTVTYTVNRGSIAHSPNGTWAVGSDILTNIERLEVADRKVALDIDGNAGKVAKILASVFGASAVSNEEYAGIGLNLLDAGMSYETLAGLAINVSLDMQGLSHTPEAVVDLLGTNLIGRHLTADEAAPFVAMLVSDLSNVGTLGVIAADYAAIIGVVNLDALSQTGLEYI